MTKQWSRNGPEKDLVPASSANCGRPCDTGDAKPVDGNHYTMVKFREDDMSGYPRVRLEISQFCEHALETIQKRLK